MLIDTNIFLEWLLGQERADECRTLLEKIQSGEIAALVTDFALHSIAIILERGGKKAELPELFTAIASFQGLSVLHATLEEHFEIALLSHETSLDFDDAYQKGRAVVINRLEQQQQAIFKGTHHAPTSRGTPKG